jgi:hypothetical protein
MTNRKPMSQFQDHVRLQKHQTTPTTAPQTTAPQPTTPPESPRRILGIEDPTGRIGMMMVTAGVGLMAIAIVLIVRRELKK